MTALRTRLLTGADPEAGSVTVFVVISVLGLLVLVGLVADGGAKLRAAQRAEGIAAEAARAGGQALDLPGTITGTGYQVDNIAAVQAAQAYLAAAGATGMVTVSQDRTRLLVTVHTSAPTAFLDLIGIDQIEATGSAQAQLVDAIPQEAP
ncbi:pilus assembly protein TadG-related protein [Cellulomonas sp. McL0617]|uniref:pilus assembly protein TadG-related protein n=1 Tax=Cellulomonas sp. McL0617 TaxID=3415675 RepID=UPI003CF6ED91